MVQIKAAASFVLAVAAVLPALALPQYQVQSGDLQAREPQGVTDPSAAGAAGAGAEAPQAPMPHPHRHRHRHHRKHRHHRHHHHHHKHHHKHHQQQKAAGATGAPDASAASPAAGAPSAATDPSAGSAAPGSGAPTDPSAAAAPPTAREFYDEEYDLVARDPFLGFNHLKHFLQKKFGHKHQAAPQQQYQDPSAGYPPQTDGPVYSREFSDYDELVEREPFFGFNHAKHFMQRKFGHHHHHPHAQEQQQQQDPSAGAPAPDASVSAREYYDYLMERELYDDLD